MRPTKVAVAWSWAGVAIMTMIVGFTWGGWVTGGTAPSRAAVMGEDTVVKRLAPMCVARFAQDPKKMREAQGGLGDGLLAAGDHVKEQGWAMMPGEPEPDSWVANECAKLLMATSK